LPAEVTAIQHIKSAGFSDIFLCGFFGNLLIEGAEQTYVSRIPRLFELALPLLQPGASWYLGERFCARFSQQSYQGIREPEDQTGN